MVIPRSRSSGALSMVSNERNWLFGLCFDRTLVIAAVSVVLPWSMWPTVPMFTCGFDRSNFSLPMTALRVSGYRDQSLVLRKSNFQTWAAGLIIPRQDRTEAYLLAA